MSQNRPASLVTDDTIKIDQVYHWIGDMKSGREKFQRLDDSIRRVMP